MNYKYRYRLHKNVKEKKTISYHMFNTLILFPMAYHLHCTLLYAWHILDYVTLIIYYVSGKK